MTEIKLQYFMVCIILLFLLPSGITFAENDYSKTRGDFKVFFIGESRDSVRKKIGYLEANEEIYNIDGSDGFECETLGEKAVCEFIYRKSIFGTEEVKQILIDFKEHYALIGSFDVDVKEFAKYLQIMLERTYGVPSYICPYLFLPQVKENKEKYFSIWNLNSKITGVAVTRTGNILKTRIIISSLLSGEDIRRELKQDFN